MASQERTALITGALGFVGRHLVAELERETSWDIVGLARKASQFGDRTRVLTCDLRDADLVRRVIDHHAPDFIFHLAAQSYVPKAFAAPADTILNNITSELNVLEAVRASERNPRILVVGSSEVYGSVTPAELPITEDAPFRPGNPYAVSKVAQDMLAYQYTLSYDLPIVRVRPFNHIGPGQSDRFAVSSFARQIAEAERGLVEPVVLTGNLSAERDFLDVRDVVRAYRVGIESGEPGEVYNLASGVPRSIQSLLDGLLALARVPFEVRQDPTRMRPSDTPVIAGDSSRFRRRTGWEPRIPITQTLHDTLDDWRQRVGSMTESTIE